MIGIVVAAHGALAGGIESALSLLSGKPEQFEVVELHPGTDPEAFKSRLFDAVDKVNTGDGVLVMVDVFGGTPSNTICQLLTRNDIAAVSGVNLPMAIEASFARAEGLTPDVLSSRVMAAASDGVIDIRDRMMAAAQQDDEDDDF